MRPKLLEQVGRNDRKRFVFKSIGLTDDFHICMIHGPTFETQIGDPENIIHHGDMFVHCGEPAPVSSVKGERWFDVAERVTITETHWKGMRAIC